MTEDYSNCTIVPLWNRYKQIVAFTLVDRADLELVAANTWNLHITNSTFTNRSSKYYAVHTFWNGGATYTIRLHRVLLGLDMHNRLEGDHINGSSLDNRRCNLRIVTRSQNCQNRLKHKKALSKYRGVSFDKNSGKWRAYITVDYVYTHLGLFTSEHEAGKVAEEARSKRMPYA